MFKVFTNGARLTGNKDKGRLKHCPRSMAQPVGDVPREKSPAYQSTMAMTPAAACRSASCPRAPGVHLCQPWVRACRLSEGSVPGTVPAGTWAAHPSCVSPRYPEAPPVLTEISPQLSTSEADRSILGSSGRQLQGWVCVINKGVLRPQVEKQCCSTPSGMILLNVENAPARDLRRNVMLSRMS